MKIIFIALVIALTSSSLLVQEQAVSAVPESQKRDITIPSANGDPIRISYGGNAGSVNVDGNQLADNQNALSNPNVSRQLQGSTEEEAVMDIAPEELANADEIIEMSEDDVATEEQAQVAEEIINSEEATVVQRANAILILLTPIGSGDENTSPDDDQVVLTRSQANDIKAVIALLVANIPDDNLVSVQDTVALDEVPEIPEELVEDEERKHRSRRRVRRAKALRRVSRVRAVRRRHRAMSIRSHNVSRNQKTASAFRKRRVLRLAPPHFVRYNSAITRSRHLIGSAVPKTEAQITAPTENKEVV